MLPARYDDDDDPYYIPKNGERIVLKSAEERPIKRPSIPKNGERIVLKSAEEKPIKKPSPLTIYPKMERE